MALRVREAWPRLRRGLGYGIADAALLHLAALAALWLRFDGAIPPRHLASYLGVAPAYLAGSLLLFTACGLYRRLWAFAGLFDALLLVLAAAGSTAWLATM